MRSVKSHIHGILRAAFMSYAKCVFIYEAALAAAAAAKHFVSQYKWYSRGMEAAAVGRPTEKRKQQAV